jgi:regulator of sigma E protease
MSILYFIIAISILVVVHEYGHFWVARRCGVKVLRFSVGFGKPFISVRDSQGTEYSVASIPLGGYVKMLDEREAEVPEHLKSQSFNSKTPAQKIAIAAAGPAANFLFAILAYWALFVAGPVGVASIVGEVTPDSPADYAGIGQGDELLAIDGTETSTWEDVSWNLIGYLGETGHIEIQVQSPGEVPRVVEVFVEEWLSEVEQPDPLSGLGLQPRQLEVPAVVGRVVEGSAAERAGIQTGDQLRSINGVLVLDWFDLVGILKSSPGEALQVEVDRGGLSIYLELTPAVKSLEDGAVVGFAGIAPQQPDVPESWLRKRSLDPFSAIGAAVAKTTELVVFTLDSLWKMIMGDLSVKNLSGPITIAKVAGASASGGLETFVQFLALLSVSLGVLNLLPVPMLDGGHIVFNLVEAMRGKPLPEQVQLRAMQAGMLMLLGLMVVAFYNDISRL